MGSREFDGRVTPATDVRQEDGCPHALTGAEFAAHLSITSSVDTGALPVSSGVAA